jgi:nucleotide-binding universal stress UspA family protein
MLPAKLIMAPVDFSDHSEEAVKTAASLAGCFGSELFLVHVVPAIPTLPSIETAFHEGEYEEELHTEASKRLEQLAQSLGNIKTRTEVGTANDVSMELLRIAEHNKVDLIVIATHGMTGWHKLAFGSVTEKIVRLAECPVLVLRAQLEGASSKESTKQSAVAR